MSTGREGFPAPPALDRWVEHALSAGRDTWPGVSVSAVELADRARAAVADQADPGAALSALHAADLYLATALTHGDPAALAAFDAAVLSAVGDFVKRIDPSAAFADEVRQELRERILVAPPDGAPRIAEYRGSGPLGGWVRVAAVRVAHNLRRGEKARRQRQQAHAPTPGQPVDPEMDYLRQHYGAVVQSAIARALGGLAPDERVLLSMHFIEGVSSERIATMSKVHGATIRRRIARLQERIRLEARRLLTEELRAQPGELTSVLRLVKSDFHMSVSRLLAVRESQE